MEHRCYFSFIRPVYIMLLILVATSILLLVSKILHNKVVAGYHHYLPWPMQFFFLLLPDFRYNQVLTVYYGVFSYLLSSWKLIISESCSNAQC